MGIKYFTIAFRFGKHFQSYTHSKMFQLQSRLIMHRSLQSEYSTRVPATRVPATLCSTFFDHSFLPYAPGIFSILENGRLKRIQIKVVSRGEGRTPKPLKHDKNAYKQIFDLFCKVFVTPWKTHPSERKSRISNPDKSS
jgi:hypothetical protein